MGISEIRCVSLWGINDKALCFSIACFSEQCDKSDNIFGGESNMKKALIAILLILTVCTAAVFAKGYENYSGIGAGFGFSWSKVNGGDDGGRFWRAGELAISVTDYFYFEKSPVGLYVDASFVVIPHRLAYGGGLPEIKMDTIVGFAAMIGPAFKFDLNKKLDLLLGVGFQALGEDTKLNTEKIRSTYYGMGFNAEAAYKLSDNLSLTGGVTGSMFFGGKQRYISKAGTYDISFDQYFEVRVIPKVSLYFVY